MDAACRRHASASPARGQADRHARRGVRGGRREGCGPGARGAARLADSESRRSRRVTRGARLELAAAGADSAGVSGSPTRSSTPRTARRPSGRLRLCLEFARPARPCWRGSRRAAASRCGGRRSSPNGSASVTRAIALEASAMTGGIGTEHDHLVRLLRGGDEDLLAEVYTGGRQPRRSALRQASLWCAARRGPMRSAATSSRARSALQLRTPPTSIRDPFCRRRARGRASRRQRTTSSRALAELSTSPTSREARAAAARGPAELLDEHLGDPAGRAQALERMITERPDDDDAMLLALGQALRPRSGVGEVSIELGEEGDRARIDPRPPRPSCGSRRRDPRGAPRQHDAALAALDRPRETGAHADVARRRASTARAGRQGRARARRARSSALDPGAGAPHAAADRDLRSCSPRSTASPRRSSPRTSTCSASSPIGPTRSPASRTHASSRAVGRARPRFRGAPPDAAQPRRRPRRGAY